MLDAPARAEMSSVHELSDLDLRREKLLDAHQEGQAYSEFWYAVANHVPYLGADGGLQMEMVSKQHQLLAMPMLAEVLSWQARVMHEPVAAPVANVLEKCAERLAALFIRYIQDMVRRPSSQCPITQAGPSLPAPHPCYCVRPLCRCLDQCRVPSLRATRRQLAGGAVICHSRRRCLSCPDTSIGQLAEAHVGHLQKSTAMLRASNI